MLMLTRKKGERIMIKTPEGLNITVTVAKIYGQGRVQLGFNAPKEVKIIRGELNK